MDQDAEFKELISRIRRGDESAARQLLANYEEAVRRIVRVRLTSPALRRQMDSSDVCQSVLGDFFVRTALGQFELESPQKLIALLAEMARNRVINHTKKQHAKRRDIARLCSDDVAELQAAGREESPSDIVAGKELLEAFHKRLSPEERDLAERRARGEEWADIGHALGAKPDALRVRLARAIERVADDLGLDSSRYE